jgi:uncharacterized ubiquitin-like protein YukD
MVATHRNLVRKQFLISKDSVEKLESLARIQNISASEVVRQAIDSYDLRQPDDLDMPELIELVGEKLKEAINSTQKANRKIKATLRLLTHGEAS